MGAIVDDDQRVANTLQRLAGARTAGQKREPQWFHPFPARMPVSIAEYLIDALTRREAIILDPMMGSGTTLIAAKRLGRTGIGIDRDPLAVRIARCATHSFSSSRLNELRNQILERARTVVKKKHASLTGNQSALPTEDQEFIRYWFPRRSQRQLLALSEAIKGVSEGPEQDFAWVVFSSLIIAKSAGASFALDISRSRPHKRDDKPVVAPFDGRSPISNAIEARHLSLENWARRRHRWEAPMGEALQTFPLGMESQRWPVILRCRSATV